MAQHAFGNPIEVVRDESTQSVVFDTVRHRLGHAREHDDRMLDRQVVLHLLRVLLLNAGQLSPFSYQQDYLLPALGLRRSLLQQFAQFGQRLCARCPTPLQTPEQLVRIRGEGGAEASRQSLQQLSDPDVEERDLLGDVD